MVKVLVEQGWLEGEELPLVTSDGSYLSFKGIPYATPPLGELRFQEPKPPKTWDGVRSARAHAPVCPQRDIVTGKVVDGGSEDCLYLNVYTPTLAPSTPLAVLAFIHGGGFVSGSGNSDMYGPDFLVKNDVILITLNYRLGVLGFLCLDTPEVPGNVGMKDQVAALRWVRRNISKFGGDPDNVTLFGDSAGSACAALHTLSPLSKNLFQKAIIMSDSPFFDASMSFYPQKRAFAFGKQLGCNTKDPKALHIFLRDTPVEKLLESRTCILEVEKDMSFFKMCHFVPVVEKDFGQNAFLLQDPMKILLSGDINVSHVMAGYTADEGIVSLAWYRKTLLPDYEKYPELFVPRPVLYEKSPREVLHLAKKITDYYFRQNSFEYVDFIKYLNDITFKYHIRKLLRLFQKTTATCYFYNFSGYTERNIFGNQKEKYGITGTSHFDDLMYLFNSTIYDLPSVSKSSKSYKIITNLCVLFTNFAKTGNPTPDSSLGQTWPQYDEENEACLDISDNLTVKKALDSEAIQFWDEIYQCYGNPYGVRN